MIRFAPRLLFIACCAAVPMAAHAESFYGGVAIGEDLDGRFDNLGDFFEVDTDTTAKFFFGYKFAPDWSVEGAYHHLGDAAVPPIADFGFDQETDGWSLGVRYLAPVAWPVKPYAKVGYFRFESDGTFIGIAGPRPLNEDDNGLTADVGVVLPLSEGFAFRAGYEWFDFDGGSDGGFQLGAEIHF